MRFGPLEEDATLITRYIIKVPLVFYSCNNDDKEGYAKIVAEKISNKINDNLKFIKEALNLQNLELTFHEFNDPDLSMILTCDINIDPSEIVRVIGRYTKIDIQNDDGCRIKTISQWLKCDKYFDTID